MFWQTRNASFRSVAFHVKESSETFGRRLARHEYPQRDEPYMEDMGRRAREFSFEALVIGLDYKEQRDKLIEAIEKPGAGQLVHPYYGTRVVTIGECKVTHSTEFGGSAKISISCVEAGTMAEPSVAIDTKAKLANVQTSALDAAKAEFMAGFNLDGLPSWGVGDVQSSINKLVGLDAFAGISGLVNSFQLNLGGLMLMPGSLADSLLGMIGSLGNVRDLLTAPFVRTPKVNGIQSAGGVVLQQQALVTTLVKRAALIQHAGNVSTVDLATVSDVQVARADLIQAFDDHDYARGVPRGSAEIVAQLRQVRTAALAQLATQTAVLPRTYQMQLVEPLPALVLSYAVYGDLRDTEIVKRNAVQHPGFVPAGVPIQLTAE